MENQRTELSALGEFGLIRRIQSQAVPHNPETIRGIGDDAAVIGHADGQQVLLSTDMLLEGVHFDLSYTPLPHLGYKAVAVNVSDIAAMYGIPKQIVVGLAVSNRFSVEAIDALYTGIRAACDDYKVDLVGGDTTSSRAGLVISVSVIGLCEPEKVVYRNTAKPTDILCVTGDLGGAYVGLQVLEREKQVFMQDPDMQPELTGKEYILQRQLRPSARMDIIHELRELGVVPTAMIDLSDGLASDVLHIARQSGVGVALFEDKLPIDSMTYQTAVEMNIDPVTCALNGGEDYELLFTIRQADFEKVKNHADISFIGYIQEASAGEFLVTKNGNRVSLQAQGWTHF
ncbi:MAG: thiamine-phosphate kinase [Cytophagales bacterium]|nr:thiamine-phosphate kinase [Cytophagales bacterium]